MGDTGPARGAQRPNWGNNGDPEDARRFVRLDLSIALRHSPDPIAFGLAPEPVTGWRMTRSTFDENTAVGWDDGQATDAARRPSRCRTEPMRLRAGATTDGGSIPRGPPTGSRHPAGIELSDLSDRFVGTERFLRRRAGCSAVASTEVDATGPRKAVWCRSNRARHRCREPSRCRESWEPLRRG